MTIHVATSDEECACHGEQPEWNYHHPDACGATAQAFVTLTHNEIDLSETWNEPRSMDATPWEADEE